MTKRILSGAQPTGKLHLGNYFGAVRQHIALQNEGQCFYFIADYHALTTIHDPMGLSDNTRDVALDYLALGLVGIEAEREVVQGHVAGVVAKAHRVMNGRERVVVGDEVEALALVLQGDVLADGAEVVAQVEFARGLGAAQDALRHGNTFREFALYLDLFTLYCVRSKGAHLYVERWTTW